MDLPAPASPLVDRFSRDLDALTGPGERIGLAVSGGPDSLALLLLAHAARRRQVEAASVDHGLRAESGEEAALVASVCARLGVPHEVLPVEVETGRASLQRSAREARYAALVGWLGRRSLRWLATAHHADDQAETLIMRLLRGSGVGGLAAIRVQTAVPGASDGEARLVRPLLHWRRDELAAAVAGAGLVPATDPSNLDDRFDRVRIRRHLAEAGWLDPSGLARSAEALAEADGALDWCVENLWSDRVVVDSIGIKLAAGDLPAEILRRLLARILAELADSSARGEEIGRFAETLRAGKTATLGGVKGSGGAVWAFERAPPRRGRG
jgi:tRNA(Ile)-lysidine synthase